MSAKQKRRAIFSIPILAGLAGCANGSPVLGTRVEFCLIYRPVYTHQDDTELTRRQVDENNAAWLRLCL